MRLAGLSSERGEYCRFLVVNWPLNREGARRSLKPFTFELNQTPWTQKGETHVRKRICDVRRGYSCWVGSRYDGGQCGRFRLEEIPGQDCHLPRQQQSGVPSASDLQERFREVDRYDAQGRWLP